MRTFFQFSSQKKFPSHVVFVGGAKICFLSLKGGRAKRGQVFGVQVNAFTGLVTGNYHYRKLPLPHDIIITATITKTLNFILTVTINLPI